MKPIKVLILAGLLALGVTYVSAIPAMAGSTSLCTSDENPCAAKNQFTHVHETTLSGAKAKLLDGSGSTLTECDVLFLGDALSGLSSPLVIHGHFTYTNCSNGCSAQEVTGTDTLLEVLRWASERADEWASGEVRVKCIFFTCLYELEPVSGSAWGVEGPLISFESNGEVVASLKSLTLLSGSFCPLTTRLDITLTPLSATYISS